MPSKTALRHNIDVTRIHDRSSTLMQTKWQKIVLFSLLQAAILGGSGTRTIAAPWQESHPAKKIHTGKSSLSRTDIKEFDLSSVAGKEVLVVFAHPDDSDFYVGGTVARLTAAGAHVTYLCATRGDKGDSTGTVSQDELAKTREAEQRKAAKALGVADVEFLGIADGEVTYNRELIGLIVERIRKLRPAIVVSLDTNVFDPCWGVNHSDHRAIALATIDAVYPYSRNPHMYPGLPPHTVSTLLSLNYREPNCYVDISGPAFAAKTAALTAHTSQWGDAAHVVEKARALGMHETFVRADW